MPVFGIGTWRMGESRAKRGQELEAIKYALELDYPMIDTAEMYGDGGAEEVVGLAVADALRAGTIAREQLFVVSKVYPHNASAAGMAAACERSLERLRLDHIDLYLLHWPGPHPLHETVVAFEDLQARGRIRHWGVSNFDLGEMDALAALAGGERCAVNQVYYSLGARGVEFDLLPWQLARSMPLMAYCPLDQGALARGGAIAGVAQRHGASAARVALAWLMTRPGVIAIPKAVREDHQRDNLVADRIRLTAADLAEIDGAFPAPRRRMPLAMR
jgi:diketogulonate reductase-like aldo/keto reductase